MVGNTAALPSKRQICREQLIVHSDFHVPSQHRIFNELVQRRQQIATELEIPLSDEPIHIYLFEDARKFRSFMSRHYPAFPDRRAFFVKSDTSLVVFAYWGERVAEDLRHEVTHGYLHSVVPNLPLWLDEGIAEYYETPMGTEGFNAAHIQLLANAARERHWSPDLELLESIDDLRGLNQLNYAESWLWVHFLLHEDSQTSALICEMLEDLRTTGKTIDLSAQLQSYMPDVEDRLTDHLKRLAESL